MAILNTFPLGGGHAIMDTDGTTMAKEEILQFSGLDVSDDSTNEKTEIKAIGLNADSLDDICGGNVVPNIVQGAFNYSTNEQVIGKWIDGKPLYQKTVTSAKASGTAQYQIPLGIGANSFVCHGHEAHFIRTTDNAYFQISGIGINSDGTLSGDASHIAVYPTDNYVTVRFAKAWLNVAGTTYVTIRYTKTAD